MKYIGLSRYIVKPLLWVSQFFNDNNFIVVCKGYNEDDDYYTGLYWEEDKIVNFSKEKEYYNFQLWFKIPVIHEKS